MTRVLIVEDSPVAQEFLAYIFASDPSFQVVGFVSDGAEAVEAARQKRPDVITMDIHMPKLDGFEATRAIMESVPTPIVIVSASAGAKDGASVFRALEAGALAVVLRPPGIGHPQHAQGVRELLQTVKLMSEIKVVRRFSHLVNAPAPPSFDQAPKEVARIQVIAVGASTGGPPALQRILSELPRDLVAPILIVQHIASGFASGFAEWLGGASRFPVHVAVHGEQAHAGHAYVPPDGQHMGVGRGPRIVLSDHAAENGLRPAVAYLFRTVAQVFGSGAVGVLLTGMGRDGASGLRAMKDLGAITIAQDAASSVVHGMPGEAIRLGGATYVLPPEGIAAMLAALAAKGKPS